MNEETKKWLASEEGKEYIEGLLPDRLKTFLETDEGKKLIQPVLDKNFSKGLETWKTNNLSKTIEDEIAKRFPGETEAEKRLRQLEAEIQSEKKARVHESLKNKALSEATKKNLPIDLVDYFVGEDETATDKNLAVFQDRWTKAIQAAVDGKFKASGREPGGGDPEPGTYTKAQLEKMTHEEINKNWEKISQSLQKG